MIVCFNHQRQVFIDIKIKRYVRASNYGMVLIFVKKDTSKRKNSVQCYFHIAGKIFLI